MQRYKVTYCKEPEGYTVEEFSFQCPSHKPVGAEALRLLRETVAPGWTYIYSVWQLTDRGDQLVFSGMETINSGGAA